MITAELSYQAPETLEQALDALAAQPAVTLLAGGMSLVPSMNLGLVSPTSLVSLRRIPELRSIRAREGWLEIGSMACHQDVAMSVVVRESCAALAQAAASIGDRQVRNRGTIGGSLAQAESNADLIPPLLVLGAQVVLRGSRGKRVLPVERFVLGARHTDRRTDELVVGVWIPTNARSGHARFAPSAGAAPLVTAAAVVGAEAAVVAVGGPCPAVQVSLPDAERATVEHGVRDAVPLDDPWTSQLLTVVAWRAIERATSS